jgi:hypothetical protein
MQVHFVSLASSAIFVMSLALTMQVLPAQSQEPPPAPGEPQAATAAPLQIQGTQTHHYGPPKRLRQPNLTRCPGQQTHFLWKTRSSASVHIRSAHPQLHQGPFSMQGAEFSVPPLVDGWAALPGLKRCLSSPTACHARIPDNESVIHAIFELVAKGNAERTPLTVKDVADLARLLRLPSGRLLS